MRKHLPQNFDDIFILLGPACNLHCRYCLQDPMIDAGGKRAEVGKATPELIDFLHDVASNQQYTVRLHFFGGEPTVNLGAMREIIEATKDGVANSPRAQYGDYKDFTYSMITNGVLMDAKLAKWCNDVGLRVAVSWDGPNTMQTRGFDVFASKKRKDALFSLPGLGITGVLSKFAYPLELIEGWKALDKEYNERTGGFIGLNIDPIMDTGLYDRELLDVDYARVNAEMKLVAAEYEKKLKGEEHDTWYAQVASQYVDRLSRSTHGITTLERGMSMCCAGWNVLNVDLEGNLYHCHNATSKDRIIGTINTPYFEYVRNLLRCEPTRENSHICKDCPAVVVCGAGCPMVSQKAREETYCKMMRAEYMPFVEMVLKLGAELPDAAGKDEEEA